MRMAAIYARVSSEQQREENTIASQTASLIEFAKEHELEVPAEWVFEDEGFSGATLERPGLERVRDLAADGQIQAPMAGSASSDMVVAVSDAGGLGSLPCALLSLERARSELEIIRRRTSHQQEREHKAKPSNAFHRRARHNLEMTV
jgi:hypothetical protein